METLLEIWQHLPEKIDPNILQIGSYQLRYYGLMYIVALATVYLLVLHRTKDERLPYAKELIQNYFVWTILAIMIGGRLGYVLFYDFSFFAAHPWRIIVPFSFTDGLQYVGIAGMSYHGGLLAIVISTVLFCRRNYISFWDWTDLFCPAIPLGYTFGRIGNFINGELFGRVATGGLGMYFPDDPTHQLRHPSQLYEALGEGIFLFIILWSIRKRRALKGLFLPLYLLGYGAVRFGIEFTREPDPQLGFILGPLTMGQTLCVGMIGAALLLIGMRRRAEKNP